MGRLKTVDYRRHAALPPAPNRECEAPSEHRCVTIMQTTFQRAA
ncbi:MAG: hypothetical protein ACK5HA_07285 [Planctomycetaceae bacterium]